MKQSLLPLLLTGMLTLVACAPADDTNNNDALPPDLSGQETSAAASVDTSDDMSDAGDTSDARIIEMSVDEWSFAPATITAAKGEKIIVRLKGEEGAHSFAIPDLNINIPIAPGETKDVEIPTGTSGTFAYRCLIPCGPGHRDMVGQLIVS